MRVDELGWLSIDNRGAMVHVQVDFPESIVRIVSMPPNERTSVWLDPIEPIILVGVTRPQLKSNLDPGSRHRVLLVPEELSWIGVTDDAVRAGFAWLGTSSSNVGKHIAKTILDSVLEPLALQVCPVCEKNYH